MPFPSQEWRDTLQQASFRGTPFYVEVGVKQSGRRTVVHQFPKSDIPYAEDMGRRARAFLVTGYIIGPNFFSGTFSGDRDALENALEDSQSQGPGTLILPTRGLTYQVTCISYGMSERRIWGGYAECEMSFVEGGVAANSTAVTSTTSQITNTSNAAASAATDGFNTANPPTPTVTVGVPTVTGQQ